MKACQNCGQINADDAVICSECAQPLGADIPPPRLLAQIQGLIPPEPIISSGRRTAPAAPEPPKLALDEALAAAVLTAAANPAEFRDTEETEPVERIETADSATVEIDDHDLPPPARFATMPDPEPQPPPPWSPTLVLIALTMVGVILLGQYLPATSAANAPRRPDVEMAFSFVEILSPGALVLLAWDYEPTVQGEMQLLAQPLLNHLAQRGVRIANVSLRPTGPAVAADAYAFSDRFVPLSAQVARPAPIDLGFVPGDAAALQALALAPASAANLPDESVQALGLAEKDELNEFQLIIEFSAETAATQEWVEQITTRQDIPFIVVASGAVGPALRPYQQTGQIAALVESYTDALAYEALLGQDAGPAAANQHSQTLALLVVLAAAFLGAILPRRNPSEDNHD